MFKIREKNCKIFVYTVLAASLLIIVPTYAAKKESCDTCSEIVEAFYKGMEKTVKANFGGGNTDWEERKLGSYARSETRLVEIVESLCGSSECHAMVEEHEEALEKWWFKLQDKDKDLKVWFCINEIKVCCPNGTYGAECKECPGGKSSPCNEHGDCQGAGTRSGSGKCDCHSGYEGDACDECTDDYYEDKGDDGKMSCKACHESCFGGCHGGTAKDCSACKSGWEQSEEEGCKDVDECQEVDKCSGGEYCVNEPGSFRCEACHESCKGNCSGEGPKACQECNSGYNMTEEEGCKDYDECAADTSNSLCSPGEYCKNSPGSFECKACDPACETCIGDGPGSCSKCSVGYQMKDNKCTDVDECESSPCDAESETCSNSPGSYSCECRNAYERKGDKCVKRKKDSKKEAKEEEDEDDDDEESPVADDDESGNDDASDDKSQDVTRDDQHDEL
ncbi:cysteine-rich with EGF-like domain protein 2 isoform X2 [Nematostella vectensis]|uniref:cysteine-rich with EGF-like domain protein 2 isoform X2 n=1 Tax=Nematostella vectensis TaxID=45351 RepID=UPI00138FF28B|nr:cysteine-rich with EGF-like domain protein 2 isoform X2 [Nematostella vectensis]